MNIGIIGIGYWGKNLVRVLSDLANVTMCCHTGEEKNQEWLRKHYPEIQVTTNPDVIYAAEDIDAVVIATPIETHFELAERAIRSGKDVFVEKPLATSHDQAVVLADLAAKHDCCIFTGYIFVYHSLIQALNDALSEKTVTTIKFTWQKLGGFTEDILFDLVSHPVAVVQHLFGRVPSAVTYSSGLQFVSRQDTSYVEFRYDSVTVQFIIDRFSTHDSKSLTLSTADGSQFMWDDNSLNQYQASGRLEQLEQRTEEPLRRECTAFIRSVETGSQPRTNGLFAAGVNHTLERIRAAEST